MSKSNIYSVYVYDCEKYDSCKNGRVRHEIEYENVNELRQKILDIKNEQVKKNLEYRNQKPKNKKQPKVKKTDVIDVIKAPTIIPVYDNTHEPVSGFSDTEKRETTYDKPDETTHETLDKHETIPEIQGLPDIDLDAGTGNSIVILGSSKAGKTHVLQALTREYFEPTNNSFHILFSVNSHAAVYDEFRHRKNMFLCNKFDKNTSKLINQLKKVNMETNNKYEYLIILDDIIDSKFSNVLNNLILTYRNSNFSSIIALQYPFLLSKASRSSINQCIFGHFNTSESIETVIKSFLGDIFTNLGYKKLNEQIAFYRKLTEDYHFLYYYSRKNILIRFKINI